MRKLEVSPRADDPHVYVRFVPVPGGKERRLGLRNVVAACWLPDAQAQGLRLDEEGRVEQEACRVVHIDGNPHNNAVSNLKVVAGAVARKRGRVGEAVAGDAGQGGVSVAVVVQHAPVGPTAARSSPSPPLLTWVTGYNSRGVEMARQDR